MTIKSVPAAEATHLLPHLLQFAPAHHAEALSLQSEIAAFASELATALEEIWTKPKDKDPESGEAIEPTPEGWATRMAEYERQRRIDPMEKVARPELGKSEWSGRLAEVRVGV